MIYEHKTCEWCSGEKLKWGLKSYLITVTASKRSPLSCKYFKTQVRTLAVVSWAAKITPMILSAIWESVRWLSFWSLAPNNTPSSPPPCLLLSLFFCINLLRVSFRSFLACEINQHQNTSWFSVDNPQRLQRPQKKVKKDNFTRIFTRKGARERKYRVRKSFTRNPFHAYFSKLKYKPGGWIFSFKILKSRLITSILFVDGVFCLLSNIGVSIIVLTKYDLHIILQHLYYVSTCKLKNTILIFVQRIWAH